MTVAERSLVWVASVLLAVLGLGLALVVLETPAFTAAGSSRFSRIEEAGITPAQAHDLAEKVRAYVIAGEGTLPATFEGRVAFDPGMVSHLDDVRDVIAGAHILIGVLLALAIAGALIAWRLGRLDLLGAALVRAGGVLVVSVAVVGVGAVVDFDAFFATFHSLFFAAGTWTFPYDSLLIQLFPEGFWVTGGITWGVLGVVVGGAFLLVGRLLWSRHRDTETAASVNGRDNR